jgi:hypothetical protein
VGCDWSWTGKREYFGDRQNRHWLDVSDKEIYNTRNWNEGDWEMVRFPTYMESLLQAEAGKTQEQEMAENPKLKAYAEHKREMEKGGKLGENEGKAMRELFVL